MTIIPLHPQRRRERIRFTRCHVTEEAARNLVTQDVAAFQAAFPDTIQSYAEHVLRQRYADYGVIGCTVWMDVLVTTTTYEQIDTWMHLYSTAMKVEAQA